MLLNHAIKRNVVSLAQAQNDYKTNVVTVNTLVTSVLSSQLPALRQNPPDWNDFVNAYEQANSDALSWVNNVMSRLLDVPDEVQGYNSIISSLLNDAGNQATALVQNPANQTAYAILNNDLTSLSNQLNIITSFISGALNSIKDFQNKLPDMAKQLNTIATKSIADSQADQSQIDQLNADIDALHSEIDQLTASIVALGIADAAALTLGTVATIVAFPVGAVAWLFLAPAIAVATTYIVLDAEKISADNAKIKADESQIDDLTADVSTLSILSKNYQKMADSATAIQTNLQSILAEWQQLETDVNEAINDIQAATSDTSKADFTKVEQDINNAKTEWEEAYNQAGALHLDLQVNNAVLQIGMSSDDVKAATENAQTVDIIQYYNQLHTVTAN
jgi:predicted  nucleic acid-binding Zn-ribbon protein